MNEIEIKIVSFLESFFLTAQLIARAWPNERVPRVKHKWLERDAFLSAKLGQFSYKFHNTGSDGSTNVLLRTPPPSCI